VCRVSSDCRELGVAIVAETVEILYPKAERFGGKNLAENRTG